MIPRPRQPGDDMSNEPPHDVTIGELWRTQQVIVSQLTAVAQQLGELPDRMINSPSWTAMRQEMTQGQAALNARMNRFDDWKNEAGPLVVLLQERVALLQRLIYGAVAATMLAVLAAVLSVVLTHH